MQNRAKRGPAPHRTAPRRAAPHRVAPRAGDTRSSHYAQQKKWRTRRRTDNDSLRRENVRLCAKLLKHDLFCKFPELAAEM
ncbi:hypothetical protein B5X24_HaOG205727 [Helicoverpa armigera]|uniref:Uncharacterized protein n=1 Tax=Helicoverpa armigera TaxID=29058 RepID=A0A2W1BQ53_HELAM|nr:hypothetical protein B5X24_HaOG205727 [Helicoverpa armigera]